jgi:5-methylcytosine-specific restriction endonuclease McrA
MEVLVSQRKKEIRDRFRNAVFKRDDNRCRACGESEEDRVRRESKQPLDAHHITDRNLMPNGGYVPENGISLCPVCHEKAEVFHSTGTPEPGFSPDELYAMIGSSYDDAFKASEKLK